MAFGRPSKPRTDLSSKTCARKECEEKVPRVALAQEEPPFCSRACAENFYLDRPMPKQTSPKRPPGNPSFGKAKIG
jgi:hypothetical protein